MRVLEPYLRMWPTGNCKHADPVLPYLAGDETFPVTRTHFSELQRMDPTLTDCYAKVVSDSRATGEKVAYLFDGDVLVRTWCSLLNNDSDCDSVYQIVVPVSCRQHVLSVAHEGKWAGHLGINKTYRSILRHFYWPRLKSDVVKHCRTCHVCQIVGKPNQAVPPAPLNPIPVIGEPFERIILFCEASPKQKMLDYVRKFRERLQRANALSKTALGSHKR